MTRELFRAARLPVLQNLTFDTAEEARASATGDVVLVQDERTGLVFNVAFDPSLVKYGSDYQNEQACSGAFRDHLNQVLAILNRHMHERRLLEIGCGKGHFLECLRGAGYDATGIDPAYEGSDPHILKGQFDRSLGLSADGIVLRHVLEHVPDPVSFLSDICHANRGRGLVYIEVPCFRWILEHRTWFDVFYEHVNYFSLPDFVSMFGRIHDSGKLFGGQYLYVIADLSTVREPRAAAAGAISVPIDFTRGVDRAVETIRRDRGKRHAIWGSTSKGVIFSLYLERAGIAINEMIDINPARQGRFLPCTGLAVASPEEAATRLHVQDNVFVMNSNYLGEIMKQSHGRYTYLTVEHG